ncbi:Hypothetical_protein [Hexamita inflata]|uniref:Hypothetical_protein n=1 Tax=Hexamita inflata TaxID=28002 RepID=A0AA86Q8Z3_9EUKA|nr:Hypothetical protein HINF_LOCUS40451 [Hexamita inflata]
MKYLTQQQCFNPLNGKQENSSYEKTFSLKQLVLKQKCPSFSRIQSPLVVERGRVTIRPITLVYTHTQTLIRIKRRNVLVNQLHKIREIKKRKMNQDDKHATDSPQTPNKHLAAKTEQSHQEKPILIPSNPPTVVNEHPDQTQVFARMEYAAPLSEPAIIPEEIQVKAAVSLEQEYDMGLNDDTPYYVRELIDGSDCFNYSPYRFE